MTTIFFDTGPIISLVMSRLAFILPKLKEQCNCKFYITPAVKYELVERPINIKRFEFEAIQVLKLIRDGVLEVYENVPAKKVQELKKLANSSFSLKGKTMDVMQEGELESVASALAENAQAVVVDERTLRLFIENNKAMKSLLERRFKGKVTPNMTKANQFSAMLKKLNIIRSIELVGVAYKMGVLEDYIPKRKMGREILVDSILWATKFNGCAVTEHEIQELYHALLKK